MYKGFCHSCQLFTDTITGFCGTCNDLIEITGDYSPANTFSQNTSVSSSEPVSHYTESPTFVSQNRQTQINNQNYERQPQNTTVNRNVNYVNEKTGLQGNIYKNSFTGNNDSGIKDSEGYSILTLGIIGLILFVGLGFGITYTRAYFAAMPDKIAKEATDARNDPTFQKRAAEFLSKSQNETVNAAVPATTQKPWFSSWFGANPTAEEIFEKHEKETLIEGKNLSAQSMYLSGKLNIKSIKPKGSNETKNITVTSDFEMSLKVPNKAFIRMEMKSEKPAPTPENSMNSFNNWYYDKPVRPSPNIKVGVIAGSDGTNRWSVTRALINGSIKTQESNSGDESSIDKALNNPDAFIFNRQKYQSIEFLGIENVGEKKAYLLKVAKQNGETDLLYFDIETGLIINFVAKDHKMLIKTYGRFEGVKMPSSFQIEMPEMTFQMDIFQMKPDVPFDDSIFLRSSYK
jgi:hypothetical protein